MMIPTGLVLVPLLVAFVLEVLSYYKLNPERVFSVPFIFLATPLILFLLYLGLDTAGVVPARWSALYLVVGLANLAIAVRRTRFLKTQAQ